ncbi:HAD-IIIA family hydrolase [Prochlorococcus sp. MIT 1300]|uniref:D-glycero-alpha-D-manno-heptose-1,7-bisphosphate 7-phosphatase n=1 Tax=Prochlorococcus sp. MIT 1300 TaxID=3096218 RepID=UPI002A7608F2|nr:HAD-IIIA family hydrolase [Prochlorococcus sp. MIT 1300]
MKPTYLSDKGVHILNYSSEVKTRPTHKALFLDRDGVIIEDCHYISRSEDVCLINGVSQLILRAQELNYAVIVVTNQAGIGKGIFSWNDYLEVNNRMMHLLEKNIHIQPIHLVLACPFHPEANQKCFSHPNHPMRKPNPGMSLLASEILNLDLQQSIIIGDKECDIQAGIRARMKLAVHVLTGHGAEHRNKVTQLNSDSTKIELVSSIGDPMVLNWLEL